MNTPPEEDWEEISDRDLHEIYDDFLDEINPKVMINGISYQVSDTFKKIDPTAYRCGFNDWLDGESEYLEHTDGKFYKKI
jgi:hypothetical protein